MFITIGLALYSLRRIKIMRAIGTLKNEDAFRIVYKKVKTFNLEYKHNDKKGNKMSTVGRRTTNKDGGESVRNEMDSLILEKETVGENR